VKDPVTVSLEHLCVGVEAGIAKFGNLLRQKFDSVGGVAEDD
jgi:hypothetical protein